jgi:DnaK suppressor protein
MSTHLTPGQRALMESALVLRRQQLERQIAEQLHGASRPEHAREVLLQDGDDAPARDADREVDLARSDQDIQEIRAVNDALGRLHVSGYGLCRDCGAEIPFDRLKHHPQVLRCVRCQAGFEAHHGSPHPAKI